MFPIINDINDVERWIKNNTEIGVYDKGDYTVIKYNVVLDTTFKGNDKSAKIRQECRGIVFGNKGKILSRPYHKFFNLNERFDTMADKIDWTKPHVVLAKLDGSMIHPIYIDGKARLATKAGLTDTSFNAEEFLKDKKNYYDFMNEIHSRGFTPIFEWVSKKNKIVLDYEDNLILTGIRHNFDGHYISYQGMKLHATYWNIPIVDKFDSIEDIETFISSMDNMEDIEGFVIRFEENGFMVKVKLPWYVLRHRSREVIDREIDLVDIYFSEQMDDFKSAMVEEDRKKIDDFVVLLEDMIQLHQTRIGAAWDCVKGDSNLKNSKKDFALSEYAKTLDPSIKSAIFTLWDSENYNETVYEITKKYLIGKSKTLTSWEDYKKEFKGE